MIVDIIVNYCDSDHAIYGEILGNFGGLKVAYLMHTVKLTL